MKSRINVLLAAAFLSMSASNLVLAASNAQSATKGETADSSATAVKLTSGEVRKVDTEQGKITIKHEAIANLDMPAMTMVFKTTKPELLKSIKAGDKIAFRAESVAGAFTVTDI